MTIAIFGLSVTSSWGNGHATFWRALCRSLAKQGHLVIFFERDQPFYRMHRDLDDLPDHVLHVYRDWDAIRDEALAVVRAADASIVTSYCADAQDASTLILEKARGIKVFYDMDTPVTLERLAAGLPVDYLPRFGFAAFDLVLSYAGGPALDALTQTLGARRALPIYGCIDPDEYPVARHPRRDAAFTYLGTYAEDRAEAFGKFVVQPAQRLPASRIIVGGPQYPDVEEWPTNIEYRAHVGQPEHLAFYASGRFTLNLTRGAMCQWGWCPSGRLFEAAACGTPLLTDVWPGLSDFFTPGEEIIAVESADDVVRAVSSMDDAALRRMADRARERVLDTCTADVRALDFEAALQDAGADRAISQAANGFAG